MTLRNSPFLSALNCTLYFLLFLAFAGTIQSCKSEQTPEEVSCTVPAEFRFHSERAAGIAILQDSSYLRSVSLRDISLQLGESRENSTRPVALETYRRAAEGDAFHLGSYYQNTLACSLQKLQTCLEGINPNFVQEPYDIAGLRGMLYGDAAFFTRGNTVFIPEKQIPANPDLDFLKTLAHEWFHIYSRNHPERQKEMYALIGFTPTDPISLPTEVEKRKLLNPDALSHEWKIEVKHATQGIIEVVPLLTSKEPDYTESKNGNIFFDYLEFQLFALDETGNIITDDSGFSTILIEETDYLDRVNFITDYTIHPEEILADHFAEIALDVVRKGKRDPRDKAAQDHLDTFKRMLQGF